MFLLVASPKAAAADRDVLDRALADVLDVRHHVPRLAAVVHDRDLMAEQVRRQDEPAGHRRDRRRRRAGQRDTARGRDAHALGALALK